MLGETTLGKTTLGETKLGETTLGELALYPFESSLGTTYIRYLGA
jgi:hypothetical protein